MSWIKNIGSGSSGRLNIIGVITRYAAVGVMEEEAGQGFKLLQRLEGVSVNDPSPGDQLLRRWTADNQKGGLPIIEGTLLVPAIT